MREEHPTVHNLMGTYMLIFMHRTDNTSKDLVLSEAEPNKAQGQQGIQYTRRRGGQEILPYPEGELEEQLKDEKDKECFSSGKYHYNHSSFVSFATESTRSGTDRCQV